MEKKKRISIPVVLFAVAVAVVGFLLAMGNYLVAIGITAVVLLVVLYWQWPNILSLRGQTEYAKGNNTKALALLKKANDSSQSRTANSRCV